MTGDRGRVTGPEAATAYHEAGHAVVGQHLGFGAPKSLTIVPTDDRLGATEWSRRRLPKNFGAGGLLSPDQRDRVERDAVTLLAGPLAEEKFTGNPNPVGAGIHELDAPVICTDGAEATHSFSEDGDLGKVQRRLEHLNDSMEATAAHLAWLEQRTRDVLDNPVVWQQVEAVAEALLERGTLNAADVKAVCAEAVTRWSRDDTGGGA